jgi:DNA-binding response OmpR family regulator
MNSRRLVHYDPSRSCILTEKETEILSYLYNTHPAPISRDILLKEVWGYTEGVTTHTVETHIYKLKQKVIFTSGENLLTTTEEGYSLHL